MPLAILRKRNRSTGLRTGTGRRGKIKGAPISYRLGAKGAGEPTYLPILRDPFVAALDEIHKVDYRDHMIASVRESKARLSELIAKASAGEEVMITVRGKPAVRLVPVPSQPDRMDFKTWAKRRREKLHDMPATYDTSAEIIEVLREERF